MMGASQRRKGHDFEREIARRFREVMPGAEVKRGLQPRGTREAADVVMPVFWPECRRGKQPNIRKALADAEAVAPEGLVPIGIVRDDHARALVVIGLEDFLCFMREWWAAGGDAVRALPRMLEPDVDQREIPF